LGVRQDGRLDARLFDGRLIDRRLPELCAGGM
jgi:hypothetical protein